MQYLTLLAITLASLGVACLFAGLVMWAIIHLQDREMRRECIERRLNQR